MTTNYPGALDDTVILRNNFENVTATDDNHYQAHNNIADAVLAIQNELGANPSGLFATVVARLATLLYLSAAAGQTFQSAGDWTAFALRATGGQTASLFQVRSNADAVLGSWSVAGAVDAVSYEQGGAALSTSHLSDGANLLKNPSPSITTPTISGATMTGTPAAPTAANATNTTQIATTAFVLNQGYAKLNNAALTGTPTAPTAALDTSTTQIATTAFVVDQITDTPLGEADIGTIVGYAGATIPIGWTQADGRALSRTTYDILFAQMGTSHGAGNGTTTFNIPNFATPIVTDVVYMIKTHHVVPQEYGDAGTVVGDAVIESGKDYPDTGTVVGVAQVRSGYDDAAVVTGDGVVSGTDTVDRTLTLAAWAAYDSSIDTHGQRVTITDGQFAGMVLQYNSGYGDAYKWEYLSGASILRDEAPRPFISVTGRQDWNQGGTVDPILQVAVPGYYAYTGHVEGYCYGPGCQYFHPTYEFVYTGPTYQGTSGNTEINSVYVPNTLDYYMTGTTLILEDNYIKIMYSRGDGQNSYVDDGVYIEILPVRLSRSFTP